MKFNIFIRLGVKGLVLLIFFAKSIFSWGGESSLQDSIKRAPRVKILTADVILRDMSQPDVQRLVGEVLLQYRDVFLSCDSAWRYDDGRFTTMGRVRMRDDFNVLTAEAMEVDPMRESTRAWSRHPNWVVMKSEQGESESQELVYDMDKRTVRYDFGGTLTQEGTRMVFDYGQWNESASTLMLGGNVSIDDGQDRILSDSLHLVQVDQQIEFFGESVIMSKDSSLELHCKRGQYSSTSRSGWFGGDSLSEPAWVRQESRLLQGDSLILPSDSAAPREAWGRVVLRDTEELWHLEGVRAKQFMKRSEEGLSMLVGDAKTPALLTDASGQDTLYVQADTLQLDAHSIRAWPQVILEQGPSMALCDTLIWNELDSSIQLQHEPLLWMEGQFLRADSVTMIMVQNAPGRLHAWGHVGLMYPAGDSCYQQIAGRDLQGRFREGKLKEIEVTGNAELVYFDAESEEVPCGEFNRAACSSLRIELENGQAKTIALLDDPAGVWTSWASPEASPIIESLHWQDPPKSVQVQRRRD
tara:strand:+ start:1226 stop:2806 length:1581 start_codon:yes stop_codon:yes gene_type:complete